MNVDVHGEVICCRTSVPQFYYERLFKPAWDSYLSSEFINAIEDCENEGLNPGDYHLDQLKMLEGEMDLTNFERRHFELLLTDAHI